MENQDTERLLAVIETWASERREITGLALVGSWARGEARPESDLDLVFLVESPGAFRADPAWPAEIGWRETGFALRSYEDADYGAIWSRHVHLKPPAEIEFSFADRVWASVDPVDPGTAEVIAAGCRVLLDREGALDRLLRAISHCDDGGETSERPLSGGRTTDRVVRVGDTVRRPPGPHSAFVRRLLAHLEAAGFDGAPRTLGSDESGRDVLSYIDGEVPRDLGWHDDAGLHAAAQLIRRYHDATASLAATPAGAPGEGEVVCHNDLSPCNFVFRGGRPVAIIDFDSAALGSRGQDLGYAAWLWLDVGSPDIAAAEQKRRLDVFHAGYDGRPASLDLVEAMMARQRWLLSVARQSGRDSMAHWAADCLDWTSTQLLPAFDCAS